MKATPYFNEIIALVLAKSPFQKKKIERYLAAMGDEFPVEAETFAANYAGYLAQQKVPLEYAVSAYLEMCAEMMKCQVEFMKTGRYPIAEHDEAYETVYNNPAKMKPYMIGLAISQFLWPTHYAIYRAFDQHIRACGPAVDSYLEVGPGHGLFLNKALEFIRPTAGVTAVDISPTSIAITRSIISHFRPDRTAVDYIADDFLAFGSDRPFDFITMGEVLEHVSHPDRFLAKVRDLLNPNGRAFISTSINSPAIDHVYHYRSVEAVREMIAAAGLTIVDERVLPVEDLPLAIIIEKKITINYCTLIKGKSRE